MSLSPGTHGVVIVHGIGDQRPGDTLADFSKALCDTLINCVVDTPEGKVLPRVQLRSDVSGSPPSVWLHITSPGGKEKATWVCREAYWNDAFPAPPPTQVLWWGVNQNLRNQIKSLLKMILDPANEALPTERELEKEEAKRATRTENISNPVKLDMSSKAPVVVKSGFISGVALVLLVPLVYFVLGLVWLFHFVPSIGPLDRVIGWVRKIDPFLSSSLGDIEKYVDHQIWSANARARVENAVVGMLQDKEVNDITIVAHSMGAVVAYDALTEGGNIAEAVTQIGGANKKITFVTVGGAINRVFDMVSSPSVPKPRQREEKEIKYNDLQITKPLAQVITGFGDEKNVGALEDKFYWLDIFARRDPVPCGPVSEHIIAKAGIDPIRQMKERMVVNKDSLVFDHVAYWENRELVMPRILRAINGGTEYPWPEAGITEKKVSRRIKIALKYASLSEIILFLVALGVIAFICLKLAGTI